MTARRKVFQIALISLFYISNSYTQVELNLGSTIITEREVAIGLDVPWEILWGPDDHIWLTERKGAVRRIDPSTGNTTMILDIHEKVYSDLEPGLLGMALHPSFDENPVVFLCYIDRNPESFYEYKLVKYLWDGNQLHDEEVMFSTNVGSWIGGRVHVGSRILITEDDKMFITLGDGGSGQRSQDLQSHYGKILRLNLDGTIPDDNPIPGSYIYSYGHRNPQGLALGPMNELYSSEHGGQHSDEFNLIIPGGNYGWPEVEGYCDTNEEQDFCNTNQIHEPIHSWTPCFAVNDLVYYTHPAIPEWQNKFLMCSLGGFSGGTPGIFTMELSNDKDELTDLKLIFSQYGRIRDVCVNPHNGAIYFATNGEYYPGSGPNKIIEYRNLNFQFASNTHVKENRQFFKINPNPILDNNECILSCSQEFVNGKALIFSYQGILIKSINISSTHQLLDLNNLPSGSYFIQASNEYGSISKSLIIK